MVYLVWIAVGGLWVGGQGLSGHRHVWRLALIGLLLTTHIVQGEIEQLLQRVLVLVVLLFGFAVDGVQGTAVVLQVRMRLQIRLRVLMQR